MAQNLHPAHGGSTAEPGILAAHDQEDLLVGNELVRFKYSTRIVHWSVGVSFLICLFTGFPIWTPYWGWMAGFFGGLQVCRWLHAWSGLAFSFFAALQFVQWVGQMALDAADRRFIAPGNFGKYLSWQTHDQEIGKYNGGQKLLFWTSSLAALGLLLTGVVLWYPGEFGAGLRQVSWVLHDVVFILLVMLIMGHVYLGLVEPGTLTAMVKGTVSKDWARTHHPKWFRDVTGGRRS
jgi:formate dehydrogenase subunit gamma